MKSFEEIVPKWSEKIKEFGVQALAKIHESDHRILDMNNIVNCILGEAWHFSSDYEFDKHNKPKCEDCSNYGWGFYRLANKVRLSIEEEIDENKSLEEMFKKDKEEFTKHWNDKHENF